VRKSDHTAWSFDGTRDGDSGTAHPSTLTFQGKPPYSESYRRLRRNLTASWGTIFPSHATSSSGAFAAGFPFLVKGNTPMPTGTVKFFNADKGYGFIENEDGSGDSFVHITAVQAAGMDTLNKEQRVSYELETGKNGKTSAVNLQSV
jgi:CspA family cold shock protein